MAAGQGHARRHHAGPKPNPLAAVGNRKSGTTRVERRTGRKHRALTTQIGAPAKPDRLSKLAAEQWDVIVPRLVEMQVVSPADEHAIELMVEAWAEWRRNLAVIEEQGDTYETTTDHGSVMIRPHPAVKIADSARRFLLSALVEFGLTASARMRLSVPAARAKDPFQEFLDS